MTNKSFYVVLTVSTILLLSSNHFRSWQEAFWVNLGMKEVLHGVISQNIAMLVRGQQMIIRTKPLHDEKRADSGLIAMDLDLDNLVVNSGFEFYYYGWRISAQSGTSVKWTTERAHSGTKSLEVRFSGQDVNFSSIFQEVYVQPNTCYRLQAHIAAHELTDGVALETWDANRGYNHWYGGQTAHVYGSVDWIPVVRDFCTGGDVDKIQVRLRRYGGMGQVVTGTAWFDDINLFELGRIAP